MYKIDKEIKTKLTEKEIKKKLYNISSKKRRSSIFFIPNQEKFFIKEMEDSIVLYTIPYYKNRGFVPKIKIKMYSNGENTIMTMRYSLYFEAELIIIITNILLIISSLLILMITTNNRYWGLYIIIFVIFCDFSIYKTFKDETEKIMQYFNIHLLKRINILFWHCFQAQKHSQIHVFHLNLFLYFSIIKEYFYFRSY